jgi:hypothetical protein
MLLPRIALPDISPRTRRCAMAACARYDQENCNVAAQLSF